jgi:hypothetical protein
MTDLHRQQPLCFRTTDADDEQWVRQQAADAGLTPYAFLGRLVHEARIADGQPQEISR